MKEPHLGMMYSGIDVIAKALEDIKGDYDNRYYTDVLDYVLWILNDYKRLKLQEEKCKN